MTTVEIDRILAACKECKNLKDPGAVAFHRWLLEEELI